LGSSAKTDASFTEEINLNVAENRIKNSFFYWPGSDTGENSPVFIKLMMVPRTYTTRIETVWSGSLPEQERPHLITLYFDEPDHTGHTFSLYLMRIELWCKDGLL
jgi:alkaline phosphatase D